MTYQQILVASDDHDAAKLLAATLSLRRIQSHSIGFDPQEVDSAEAGQYKLVIIDVASCDAAALDICQRLRRRFNVPILLLTYEREERYWLNAYQAGVAECIRKPIGAELLFAKLNVWLGVITVPARDQTKTEAFGFSLDRARREVITPAGKTVRLSRHEFDLLQLFLSNQRRILETDYILEHVWLDTEKVNMWIDARLVKNLVYRLRHKIERDHDRSHYIQTVRGEGYAFWPD